MTGDFQNGHLLLTNMAYSLGVFICFGNCMCKHNISLTLIKEPFHRCDTCGDIVRVPTTEENRKRLDNCLQRILDLGRRGADTSKLYLEARIILENLEGHVLN